jgi:ribokinase
VSAYDVVVVGSANLDLVASTPRLPRPGETVLGTHVVEHPGGKGLNQAVAAARTGCTVAMVGTVGGDDAGRFLRSVAADNGVDTTRLTITDTAPTGRAVITVDEHAENTIVVLPGANATVAAGDFPTGTVVLAQLEIPVTVVIAAFEAARAAGSTTVLNPAPVPVAGLPETLLALCDVVVPNQHEIDLLGGVDRLLDAGVGAVIVTRGGSGVTVTESSRSRWDLPAFPADPVDTTGAGDAFCGALASQLAAGATLRDAVRYAAAAGALATTVAGAVPSLPSDAAIARLMGT